MYIFEANPGVNSQQKIHHNQVFTDLKESFSDSQNYIPLQPSKSVYFAVFQTKTQHDHCNVARGNLPKIIKSILTISGHVDYL